ncbi:hypothetical protein LR48_Vigan01g189200 [Vigna angularis]|uniref:Uncharacterized protein n=1 Tax=Phaseolus angularis TaxID=3914 RepID=A0A0L9TPD7_PHAAN|nr:hypothetical protein LR48_Vigan01g189200 [Vigna angularis]
MGRPGVTLQRVSRPGVRKGARARIMQRGSRPGAAERAPGATFADVSDPAYLTLKREGERVFGYLEGRPARAAPVAILHLLTEWRPAPPTEGRPA